MDARLTLRNITKRYPAVVANDGIDLTVEAVEIHAVLGEKGAGQLFWNGAAVHIANPSTASPLGIAMVFQHFSLFDTLAVAVAIVEAPVIVSVTVTETM